MRPASRLPQLRLALRRAAGAAAWLPQRRQPAPARVLDHGVPGPRGRVRRDGRARPPHHRGWSTCAHPAVQPTERETVRQRIRVAPTGISSARHTVTYTVLPSADRQVSYLRHPEKVDTEVWLVGTSHVSEASIAEVRAAAAGRCVGYQGLSLSVWADRRWGVGVGPAGRQVVELIGASAPRQVLVELCAGRAGG